MIDLVTYFDFDHYKHITRNSQSAFNQLAVRVITGLKRGIAVKICWFWSVGVVQGRFNGVGRCGHDYTKWRLGHPKCNRRQSYHNIKHTRQLERPLGLYVSLYSLLGNQHVILCMKINAAYSLINFVLKCLAI